MSFPFLILAGVSILILTQDVQTNINTSGTPLFIYLMYSLASTFFLFAIVRATRILQK